MNKRASLGGRLKKAYNALSIVVTALLIVPSHLLFVSPLPAYAGGGSGGPSVLGLVAEAEAQEEEAMEEEEVMEEEVMEEEIADAAMCSGLWFFPALDFLPFPWCKWWPLILLLIIVAVYYYATRNEDEEAPSDN